MEKNDSFFSEFIKRYINSQIKESKEKQRVLIYFIVLLYKKRLKNTSYVSRKGKKLIKNEMPIF
jgi:hypothetical protein